MSKRPSKAQASSARVVKTGVIFGDSTLGAESSAASSLSHIRAPLDYSTLHNPNAVVTFKNLSKKDSTTKAKALEDLQALTSSPDFHISDPFLEIWAKFFPRLSIDSDRRVRQLSHVFNGQLCSRVGKRNAKHLPTIAGPWLAGTFDNDRAVSRAASDALSLVFPTSEKVHGVRRTFQKPILEYCRYSAYCETVTTLSDERTVRPDEADATYVRVVATALLVVNDLMNDLQTDEREKEHDLYHGILTNIKLWNFVNGTQPDLQRTSHRFANESDATVRRAVYRLIRTALVHEPTMIEENISIASTAFINKGLAADHKTSALDYVVTLNALTTAFPTLWTDAYTGQNSALSKLRHFLKQGSQSSPADYWPALKNLLPNLPQEILPQTAEEAIHLLKAARTGVCRKDERFNAAAAWPTYFTLVDVTTSHFTDGVEYVLKQQAMPIIAQFLFPTPETETWSTSSGSPASMIATIVSINKIAPIIERDWPEFGTQLIELAKISQPEQSKDFEASQLQVASTSERFCTLQKELWEQCKNTSTNLIVAFTATSTQLLDDSISLVKSRNGKPYGAAAIIEQLLTQSAPALLGSEGFAASYRTFAEVDLPNLIFSPSQRQLIHGLYAASLSAELFSSAFDKLIRTVLDSSEPAEKFQALLRVMFSSSIPQAALDVVRRNGEFQQYITTTLANDKTSSSSALLADLIRLKVATNFTIDSVMSSLIVSLGTHDQSEASLSTIDLLAKTDERALKEAMARSPDIGDQLLPSVLRLEQSHDDNTSEKATSLVSRLSSVIGESGPEAKFSVILQNLEKVSEASLSVSAVIDLTRRLLGSSSQIENADDVLPDLTIWRTALGQAIELCKPSLAILSPFGGTVYLLHTEESQISGKASYDSEGYSQALRIALYISMLIAEFNLFDALGDCQSDVAALLHMTMQIAEDNLSIAGTNGLWKPGSAASMESVVLDLIAEVHSGITGYLDALPANVGADLEEPQSFFAALHRVSSGHAKLSPVAYYAALSSAKVRSNLAETHRASTQDLRKAEEILSAQRSSRELVPQILNLIGLQKALAGTALVDKYCNYLVAELTDIDLPSKETEGLQKLVLLNCIIRTQQATAATIAKQRVIFLVKRLIPSLGAKLMLSTKAEMCKLLTDLLPSMADMYGDHWEQILEYLGNYWNSHLDDAKSGEIDEGQIVLQHASLRLFARLKSLERQDEPNDDLVDVFMRKRDSLRDGLINLLGLADGKSDEMHQPLMITHELLARQLASMPAPPLQDLGDLYPLMYTPSRPIQQATFDLFHRQIPAAQEQISFDAALDNKVAKLPDELLSLILEAPSLDSLVEESFDRSMPRSLQGYLFSWRLILDHFDGSSYKVKGDYIEQLKDGTYLPDLLGFTFDFLGHSRGKPIDASKFDIQEYISDSEPSPEKDVQWLLIHLYYLALTHFPSLVKSYYLDIRSRQTSLAIESWTAKYLSPLITTTALKDVSEWAEKSVKDEPEYENMSVRVGMRSKEINVSYEIDEQTMAIKVVLPEAYPLASAQVHGVNRVAVKEEKWQSWLRNCQGVITFSNGSITDGLSAWRKNVTGALKGQSECAICYSIISADKQLPTKRCQTCKNLFHSSCLFKWFKTSNASSCPLCRTAFNFN